MYVILKSEPMLWTVGFYDPQGKWYPHEDFDNVRDAEKKCAYLNGRRENE